MREVEIRFHIDPFAIRSVGGPFTTKAGKGRKAKSTSARLRLALDCDDCDSNRRCHMPMRIIVDGLDIWSCLGREHSAVDDNGVDVIGERMLRQHQPQHPWRWVPLVHWAKYGLDVIRRLPQTLSEAVVDDWGSM